MAMTYVPLPRTGEGQRGFTLIIAVILSSVSLALAMALLDVSYKQVTLALSAKQSNYAFAAADTALECALYYDQKLDAFNYTTPLASGSITCGGIAISGYSSTQASGIRTTIFSQRCSASDATTNAVVTVRKRDNAVTDIFANGYNNCVANDLRRVERGLKISF